MSVTATTRPAKRSRKAASAPEEAPATPVKATTRKKADKPTESASKPAVRDLTEGTEQKFRVDMEEVNETKNCVVFEMPKGSACYGKLWVPKGATEVIVLVKGVSA